MAHKASRHRMLPALSMQTSGCVAFLLAHVGAFEVPGGQHLGNVPQVSLVISFMSYSFLMRRGARGKVGDGPSTWSVLRFSNVFDALKFSSAKLASFV